MNGMTFEKFKQYQYSDVVVDTLLVLNFASLPDVALMPTLADNESDTGLAAGLRTRVEKLTAEQRRNPNFKIMGLMNVGNNHYIPYFIRFDADKVEVHINDPIQPSSYQAQLHKTFSKVFEAKLDFNWAFTNQQLNGINCGANSIQTLADMVNEQPYTVNFTRDGEDKAVLALSDVLQNQYELLLKQEKSLAVNEGEVIVTGDFNIHNEMQEYFSKLAQDELSSLHEAAKIIGGVVYFDNDKPKVVSKEEQVQRDEALARKLQQQELEEFTKSNPSHQMDDLVSKASNKTKANYKEHLTKTLTAFYKAPGIAGDESSAISPES